MKLFLVFFFLFVSFIIIIFFNEREKKREKERKKRRRTKWISNKFRPEIPNRKLIIVGINSFLIAFIELIFFFLSKSHFNLENWYKCIFNCQKWNWIVQEKRKRGKKNGKMEKLKWKWWIFTQCRECRWRRKRSSGRWCGAGGRSDPTWWKTLRRRRRRRRRLRRQLRWRLRRLLGWLLLDRVDSLRGIRPVAYQR